MLCSPPTPMPWSGRSGGKPSPDRLTQRNGYRHRPLDTRVGTVDVAVPKLRSGTYFPDWLLERRKQSFTVGLFC